MGTAYIQKEQTLTGAEILVKTLKALGVECIFGYPGGIVLNLYDELSKQNDIKHYLVRHEQAAVHAAEGYARVSGKCGVVLVTSGPGAANTISGIENAYLDGYPLVVLTGQVSSSMIGKDAFQEVNIIDITKSCTKANFQITKAEDIISVLKKAFLCACSGKKAPVVVDLAKNIFTEKYSYTESEEVENSPIQENRTFSPKDIKLSCDLIKQSAKPVIVVGGGAVHAKASHEISELAQKLQIPVVSTMMGLGAYSGDKDNYFGMIGIFGEKSANQLIKEADLVISAGARFNDRITCCFEDGELENKILQLDINPKEIARNINPKFAIVGDVKEIIEEIISQLPLDINRDFDWLNYALKLKTLNKQPEKISNKLHSFEVIQAIYNHTKNMDIPICTEVGQHQLWTVKNYKLKYPNQLLTSGGLGTMGFGLPAAIGASIAQNRQPVICIAGDGSFQMNEQELATCKDYNLPIKIFILNNGYLGMVRQLQQKNFNSRYSETKISNPDFLLLAQAYGLKALSVTKFDEIPSALDFAFSVQNEPVVVEFCVEPLEVV